MLYQELVLVREAIYPELLLVVEYGRPHSNQKRHWAFEKESVD